MQESAPCMTPEKYELIDNLKVVFDLKKLASFNMSNLILALIFCNNNHKIAIIL